ncbi:Concanavalin A-like lectin/glucanases superfamily protein [Maribacter dokdonensis]|uniref:LamG domain-containing protein n=1 Tax=Maribacter dokdonensis TaxID=320912 RepID=UPI001B18885C|nr:LamG domain-containing protein [Maribacter dokdonensis]CAG2532865.1 Concanavalin A-like lectin/glucanases superfamily protein [Maribacter dokdonensis]|tara:strand:+ start:412 stop:1596 length:1185 start_codon:yes stop_codon:yes gene_type:complete
MKRFKHVQILCLLVLAQIQSNAQSDHSIFLNGLVAAYSLESSISLDDELNVNNGTVTGATTVTGNIGNALSFSGSQATMATVPTSASLDLSGSETTFMVDIYPTAIGQSGKSVILQKGWGNLGDNVYSVSYTNANQIRFRNNIDDISRDFISTITAPLNTWSRIICVWKSGEPRIIRINSGIETEGTTYTGTQTVNPGRDLTIGSYDVASPASTRSFVGNIDNVMIWNRALTTAEQNTLINENLGYSDFAPTSTGSEVWSINGPVAYYNLGNVGIGTDTPGTYKLAVNGNIRAKEIKVETANWPDYVFDKDYSLPGLDEIQKFIELNGHLPKFPSAREVETSGIELGEMNRLLLEKIEELTLYIFQQQDNYDRLSVEIQSVKQQIKNNNNGIEK